MDKKQFRDAANIDVELADKWYHHILVAMEMAQVDTAIRQAHFLAQIGTESRGYTSLIESFNYSVKALEIFGSRLNKKQRESLGRNAAESMLSEQKQRELAEIIYGGRYGNSQVGDGWKYRGRGLIQLTFRRNYEDCGAALGIDLVEEPDLLLEPSNAACSAAWYWNEHHCNRYADIDDVSMLTRSISGGFNGIIERTKRTLHALSILHP